MGSSDTLYGPGSARAVDLDADGDLELACANKFGDTLTVFFQEAPGIFDPEPLTLGDSTVTDIPESLDAADLDGDGDIDLVMSGSDALNVFAVLAPGELDATPRVLGGPGTTDGVHFVHAADLDGDGDLDLATTSRANKEVRILFQDASGDFEADPLVLGGSATFTFPRALVAGDLDGDGDADLVVADNLGNRLHPFLQESPGTFEALPPLGDIQVTQFPRALAIVDIDEDGDADIVSGSQNGMTLFRQHRRGVFELTDVLPPAVDAGELTPADMDGDGDLDLVGSFAIVWNRD